MKPCTFFLLAMSLLLSSCSKYEENDFISLRSKEKRISGKWELDKLKQDGLSVPFVTRSLNIQEDGDFYWYTETDGYPGVWSFKNDGEKIRFIYDDGGSITMDIEKLTNKELVLEVNDAGSEWRYEFEK